MKEFAGKIAFITGGASGAGLGQATVFAEAGCTVVLADLRPEALAAATLHFRNSNTQVHPIQLDVTDRAAFTRAADEVERIFGRPPDLLFNTAGVNTFGPIVTTSSIGGFHGSALAGIYSAAKAAVINLMESYRLGLEKYGIGVSVLCPANIKSNIAEATRTRPAHLASTGYLVNEATIKSLHGIYSHGMDPVHLARHVKRGIEENQLYIIPYPEVQAGLETHFAAILAAVLPMDQDPEGARKRTEALRAWQKEHALLAPPSGEGAD
jgi:NAD(P)-dependent dehydrogenase (short-subunit alcohol dehydrogenase family)